MADSVKRYTGEHVEVSFDAGRCLHAARCVNGLPAVFDTKRRPWILPDAATAEQITEIVRRCPSGALHYTLTDGEAESPTSPTRVTAREGEPVWLRGDLLIDTPSGPLRDTRCALPLWLDSQLTLLRRVRRLHQLARARRRARQLESAPPPGLEQRDRFCAVVQPSPKARARAEPLSKFQ